MSLLSSHKTRAHSKMGGSSAGIYMKCTGYFSVLEHAPKEESSPDADLGTLFHEMVEMVCHDFLEHKREGTDPEIRFHLLSSDPRIDSEMVDHIESCKKVLWEKGLDKYITGKAYGFEDYFSLGEIGGVDIGGPADFWAVYRDKKGQRVGLIVDWKYGYHYVDEQKSDQLPHYAACMFEEFKRSGKSLDYIRAAIVQPRASGPEDLWREVKFTAGQLEKRSEKIKKVAKDVFIDKKIKFLAGDHCTWCPGNKLGLCEVRKKYLQEQSGLMLARHDAALPKFESLSDEQLVKILEYKDDIIDFLKGAYSYTLLRVKKGQLLKGYKVVKGTAKRKWKDNIDEIANGLVKYKIQEPYRKWEPQLKTITEIQTELKKKVGDVEEAKSILENFTEYGNVPEILVPESDPRPSIQSYRDLLSDEGTET